MSIAVAVKKRDQIVIGADTQNHFNAETIARRGMEAVIAHGIYCGAPVDIQRP